MCFQSAGSSAGGVATGWQLAMRARSPRGPYEARTVLAQGTPSEIVNNADVRRVYLGENFKM